MRKRKMIISTLLTMSLVNVIGGCRPGMQSSPKQTPNTIHKNEQLVPGDAATDLKLLEVQNMVDLAVLPDRIPKENQGSAGIWATVGAAGDKKVNPGLFGVNMLFFTEPDSARANETYRASMEYLGPTVMRYPGGTCADNYFWKTKDIYSKEWYPSKADPVNDMDTEEFLDFAGQYGAEPVMVINYRSYIKMNDMEAFYKDAEDWVRFVNIEKKAGVKYWELGNELYFKENTEERCQVTPEQYGAHYRELRKRLKAIDPEIQLGVTLHKEWDSENYKNIVSQWNKRVMSTVGCEVDYIILHFYPSFGEEKFVQTGMDIREKVKSVRAGIAGIGGPSHIPVLITEWNFSGHSQTILGSTIGHMAAMAQGYLEIIDSDIERVTIWPMQNSDKRLIKQGTYEIEPAGIMFHWLNTELAGCNTAPVIINGKAPGVEMKAFITPDGKQLRIVAVNRNTDLEQMAVISLEGWTVNGEGILKTMMSRTAGINKKIDLNDRSIVVNQQNLKLSDSAAFKLPPVSVSMLEIPIVR